MHRILIFTFTVFLLAGCTVNPQDTKLPGKAADAMQLNSSSVQLSNSSQVLTLDEVAKHNTKQDCWMVIGGKVVDLSSYTGHPGGDTYVPYCGTDATVAFNNMGGMGRGHSTMAYAMLDQFTIGELGKPRVK